MIDHRKVKVAGSPGSLIIGLILSIAHLRYATLCITARLDGNDDRKKRALTRSIILAIGDGGNRDIQNSYQPSLLLSLTGTAGDR